MSELLPHFWGSYLGCLRSQSCVKFSSLPRHTIEIDNATPVAAQTWLWWSAPQPTWNSIRLLPSRSSLTTSPPNKTVEMFVKERSALQSISGCSRAFQVELIDTRQGRRGWLTASSIISDMIEIRQPFRHCKEETLKTFSCRSAGEPRKTRQHVKKNQTQVQIESWVQSVHTESCRKNWGGSHSFHSEEFLSFLFIYFF